MRKFSLLVMVLAIFSSCKKEIIQNDVTASQVSAERVLTAADLKVATSPYWDSVFTRYGNGWTGGDGAYSIKLPDGRSLWLWGDSFVDTVFPNRTRPIQGFIHNQMATTDALGGNFTTYHKGTPDAPQAWFVPGNLSHFYWPTSAFINAQQNFVFVMLARIRSTGEGGVFGFEVIGTDVAVLELPSLKIKTIKKFSVGDFIDWSSASLKEENGYIYLYGVESTKYNKFIHVARTKASSPFKVVQHFDGADWTTDTAKSVRIHGGVSQTFSVFKNEGKYYLVSQGNLLSQDIYIWDGAGPTGPFYNKRFLYTTPKLTSATWTYNATAHTELSQNGKLLIGYCMNTNVAAQLYNNVDTYRPYFITVEGWQ